MEILLVDDASTTDVYHETGEHILRFGMEKVRLGDGWRSGGRIERSWDWERSGETGGGVGTGQR